ncbi:RAP domain [Babesia duncani]|uniref:RAP domain n=1 Tax=Babesia duncani TaxID=323732 RepID=A0AAD9PM10_9APIC|nr:RAP domain [Babesia duncani]
MKSLVIAWPELVACMNAFGNCKGMISTNYIAARCRDVFPRGYFRVLRRALRCFNSSSAVVDLSAISAHAQKIESRVEYSKLSQVLSQFISQKYSDNALNELLQLKDSSASVGIHEYLVILEICKLKSFRDLELVGALSENLRMAFERAYNLENSESQLKNDKSIRNKTRDAFCEFSVKPNVIAVICYYYNHFGILYDPLFTTISKSLVTLVSGMMCFKGHFAELNWFQMDYILNTYSRQRYRDAGIVKEIVTILENSHDVPNANIAASIYCSLCYLDAIPASVKSKLEPVILASDLGFNLNTRLAYVNLMLNQMDENLPLVVQLLHRIALDFNPSAEINQSVLRRLTVVLACMKCQHKDTFDKLDEKVCKDCVKYTLQLSMHLKKLRIRHETNVYANGVLLDILEKDRNLVYMCNSYHRFYATTLNETAENRFLQRLVIAFGYKLCPIQYYQWGRLKAKRTRYAYIRMARYYALNDVR